MVSFEHAEFFLRNVTQYLLVCSWTQKVGTDGGRAGRILSGGNGTVVPPGTLHASISLYSSTT